MLSCNRHRAETNLTKLFRAPDGIFVNSTNVLCLTLDDFATDEISKKADLGESERVEISYEKLAQFLNKAEEMQEAREPIQGRQHRSLASRRKTRKRRRSPTPSDQVKSEDERDPQNQEEEVEDEADSDFSCATEFKASDLRRRSTRRKLG